MRYSFSTLLLTAVCGICLAGAPVASAQPAKKPAAPAEAEKPVADDSKEEDAAEGEESSPAPPSAPTGLTPPSLEPLPSAEELDAQAEEEPKAPPAAAEVRTADAEKAKTSRPPKDAWKDPQPVFTLHGYFRVRGEYQDNFDVGRSALPGQLVVDPPFGAFRPAGKDSLVPGGCGDGNGNDGACGGNVLSFANMRMRMIPELHLSDYVRIKMWVDALDNVVLGSSPESFTTDPVSDSGAIGSANYPLDSFSSTVNPPEQGRNALQDSFLVRRVWAEVRPHDMVELRFGRMGWHWGLGMLFNDGANFDGDYSTDVDRVMVIGKFAGLHLMGAYDFVSEGLIRQIGSNGVSYDGAQKDDVDQWMLGVQRRADPEEQRLALAKGRPILNAGLTAVHRSQLLSLRSRGDPWLRDVNATKDDVDVIRRDLSMYTADAWVQFLYRGFRIELEAAAVLGSLENTSSTNAQQDNLDLMQLGAAFELEYRLLQDKLGLYLYSGFASGDSDVTGLSSQNNLLQQNRSDGKISTFTFHPNYRVDLILWRNIMRRVSGAYYFRPGISYDLVHTPRGGLLGGRLDIVWSRASTPRQTWGDAADLGLEFDASLYYQSEDGPSFTDGFYSGIQFGALFPLAGLGYTSDQFAGSEPGLTNAYTLRLLLGVLF